MIPVPWEDGKASVQMILHLAQLFQEWLFFCQDYSLRIFSPLNHLTVHVIDQAQWECYYNTIDV